MEDQMRALKDRQLRMKWEEEEAKRREKEEHREIATKLKTLGANEKGRPFTFDYDGKPIAMANVRLDKLPPAAWQVKYELGAQEAGATPSRRMNVMKGTGLGSTKSVASLRERRRMENLDRDLNRNFLSTVPVFEFFHMASGATLTDGGKVKTGPKHSSFSEMSNMTMTSTSTKLQMTKTDYAAITLGGNLSRPRIGLNERERWTMASLIPPSKPEDEAQRSKATLEAKRAAAAASQSRLNLDFASSTVSMHGLPAGALTGTQRDRSKIVANDPKRITDILLKEDSQRPSGRSDANHGDKPAGDYYVPDGYGKKDGRGHEKTLSLLGASTLTDQFNSDIQGGQHWGRSIGQPLNTQLRPLPATSHFIPANRPRHQISRSLVDAAKHPRERQKHAGEQVRMFHVAPPPLGQTVGHGFFNS
jgi:hypothetical protein